MDSSSTRSTGDEPGNSPAPDPDLWDDLTKSVCLACGMELPAGFVVACGLKKRCPYCQHPYPLGDCAD